MNNTPCLALIKTITNNNFINISQSFNNFCTILIIDYRDLIFILFNQYVGINSNNQLLTLFFCLLNKV